VGKIGRNDACWCGSGKKYKKCHWGQLPPGSVGTLGSANGVDGTKNPVKKGIVSPVRLVPAHIIRPSYAEHGKPTERRATTSVKNVEELARMRVAGRAARQVLDTVLAAVEPGLTTDALDQIAHEKALELGAYPSPLNYHGFPKSLCTSVNEVICHGIPDDRLLLDGDIINCDVTVYIEGMHGDCSETVFVGQPDAQSRRLVETTYECTMQGIAAARAGMTLNEIGKAIAPIAQKEGFSIVRDFAGHGIGSQFHQDPQIVHYPDVRQRQKIVPGMTFTVEPMINVGSHRCVVWPDNWTAVTIDGLRSAQFEHTLVVTDSGYELLTGGDGEPWFKRQLARGW
jgi:methionyl aminopeptidase